MAEPLDEPFGVVPRDEFTDDPVCLGEILEAMEIEALLLQRAHEALAHAIALRLADLRGGDRHSQPLRLVDPRIGDVLRAPVTPDAQSPRDVLPEAAEHLAHPLPQGFERGPAIADLGGVPVHELVHAVIEEEGWCWFFGAIGVEACGIGAPHLIRPRGGDCAQHAPDRHSAGPAAAGRAGDAPAAAARRACRRWPGPDAPGAPAPCDSLRRGTAARRAPRGSPRRPRHHCATFWARAWPRPGVRPTPAPGTP